MYGSPLPHAGLFLRMCKKDFERHLFASYLREIDRNWRAACYLETDFVPSGYGKCMQYMVSVIVCCGGYK